jgi:hypothetical protein
MKISPAGVERHNETVTFYSSFENVPKNGHGTHKAHSGEECTEQRGSEYNDVTADKLVLLFRKILILLISFNNRKI